MGAAVTVLICLFLAALGVYAVYHARKRAKQGCCGTGGEEVRRVKPSDSNPSHYPYVQTIKVSGMTCENCKTRVENAFNEREGFYAVVNLGKKTARIHTKTEVPASEVKRIIRGAGYEPGEVLSRS